MPRSRSHSARPSKDFGVLSEPKTRELEGITGRWIAFAVKAGPGMIEFVTTSHEHFLFNKKRESFLAIPSEEIVHFEPGCREMFGDF